jgi:tetratricopeptide (TPR) repeat protein
VVNGSTLQRRDAPTLLVPMPSQLFWSRGPAEGFFDVSSVSGEFFTASHVGRGAAFADFDNDGDVDAFVTTNGGPGFLLRNDGGNRNRWLQVELRGTKSNRQGIGAHVRLVAGGASQVRQVGAQASYLSQNSLVETFGLGAGARADTVEIVWPKGTRQVYVDVASDQRLQVVEGEAGAAADRASVRQFWALMREATAQRVDGQSAAALATYQRALALNPGHADALYYAGNMQLALGAYLDAAATWRRLLALDPGSARTQSQMGALFLCLDPGAPLQLDSADAYFHRAHAINKEETGPLLRLGESALVRGDLARARQLFQTVLATHAASAPAHFYVGYLAMKAGDEAGAAREFARAQELPLAAVVAGATSEGDTKTGLPMRAERQSCDTLRALSEERVSGDQRAAMRERYRRLDSLLATARARVK